MTGEVLPDGEEGELVFTSLTKQAMPVIRYRTRDLTRLLPGTARSMRRMEKITGRTDDMIILRGVNLFPTQIEEIVLGIPTLSPHFQCHLDRSGNLDTLTVRVERRDATTDAEAAAAQTELAPADQGVHRRQRRGRRRRRGLDRALGRQDAADRRPPRGALTGGYLPATGRRGLQWSQRFRRRAAVITPDPPDTAHLAPAPHLHAVACRQSRTGSPAPRRVPQSGRTTLAQRQRQRGSRRTPAHARHKDNEGIVPVLARAVRELESAVQRGPLAPGQRVRFQVVALLVREHRTDVRASAELTDAQKADELKRLDGIATILAKTATRDPSLFALLSEESVVTDSARDLRLEMLRKAGVEVAPEEPKPDDEAGPGLGERRVIPQSVAQHQLANPFLVPDFGIGRERRRVHGRLVDLGAARPAVPLLRARRLLVLHGPAGAHLARRPRQARADAAPGRDDRRRPPRATAPSCWPTSRASARPRRRCSPRRPPTPSRCSSLPQRRQDQLGSRDRALDPAPPRDRDPR